MGIVAYEGPAGSGKGFALAAKKVSPKYGGRDDVVFLERPKLPRDLGPQVGAWSSSYLEYMAVAAATMMPEKTFYVDRFVLSRWVYKAIEENGLLDLKLEQKVARSWMAMRTLACDEAHDRIGGILRLHTTATVKVLVPSLSQLVANRRYGMEAGRVYPFSPCQEIELYRQVAMRVGNAGIPGLNIETLEF